MAATRVVLSLTLFLAVAATSPVARAQEPSSTLIRHARVFDGLGTPAAAGDVRIAGGRIVAVGALTPAPGERVVDARGLALAPGFIDTHSHHDRGLDAARDALAVVSQGITTIVVGQDGGGADIAALFARLEARPAAVNVASYVGHGELRERALGDDFKRHATDDEIARMKEMLAREMAAGALGLSTGLEYDPGIYSSTGEVRALAKVAGDAGGRYISHMRSEDRDFWEALDELIAIGRENRMPVQVSHMKLAMRSLWGQADRLVARLDAARASGVQLTADIYPYTYWASNLGVLYPKRNFDDAAETDFVLEHVAAADDIIFSSFPGHPEYAGKTLADIAAMRGTSHAKTLLDLLAASGGPDAGIVARGMSDADVERLLQWAHANVCSDGTSRGLHPRGFGSFPKVLGPYVRDKRLFSLEEAVRKMTSLAAANVGIAGRGRIAPGYAADLVLFDPATVADRADFGKAQQTAVGIHTVWVNGEVAYADGKPTGALPGRPVRRAAQAPATGPATTLASQPADVPRLEAFARMQTLNAQILASTSATRTLETWCRDQQLAADPRVVAIQLPGGTPPSAEQRQRLGVSAGEDVRHRRVQLRCGDRLLSEADNWFVPSRLSPEMNRLLDTTDTPFGRVVQTLEPYRRTFDASVLWAPSQGGVEIPAALFSHRAILYTREHQPFSEVHEVYQRTILPEPQAQTGVCKAPEEQEIAALFDRWNAALQTGDARAIVDLYAPRSVLLATLENTPLLTPADKEGYFTYFMKNRPSGRIDTRTIDIDCNTAWDAGTYTFTFGATGASVSARYTYTYRWDGTRWLITSHHSSAMPEKE